MRNATMSTTNVQPHNFTHTGKEVLILRRTGQDRKSKNDFIYPTGLGSVATAPDWNDKPECGGGLHGWPWGFALGEGADFDANQDLWMIFGCDPKDVVGNLDNGWKCKFRTGTLRFEGKLKDALDQLREGFGACIKAMAAGGGEVDGKETASGDGSKLAASGDGSKLAASGHGSKLAASGHGSKLAASGHGSNLAASGHYSKLAASGHGSNLAASGHYSKLAASGHYSNLAASGHSSNLAASGHYSNLAASGHSSNLAASGHSSNLAASGHGSKLAASGHSSNLAASGPSSNLAASGHSSNLAASGPYSKLAASGHGSNLAASGPYSKLAASGHSSNLAASGPYSKLAASGHYSNLAASGHSSNLEMSGANSVGMIANTNGRIKTGDRGCFALSYWTEETGWEILVGKVGRDGIKADTWYKVDDGKIAEAT